MSTPQGFNPRTLGSKANIQTTTFSLQGIWAQSRRLFLNIRLSLLSFHRSVVRMKSCSPKWSHQREIDWIVRLHPKTTPIMHVIPIWSHLREIDLIVRLHLQGIWLVLNLWGSEMLRYKLIIYQIWHKLMPHVRGTLLHFRSPQWYYQVLHKRMILQSPRTWLAVTYDFLEQWQI